MIADHGISDLDNRKDIKLIEKLLSLFSVIVFDMKVVAILQVKAGKAIVKESYS